uniref:Uncharacterized protein n=1 Tax=Aegilops tauschii subsp. strangulata TaxID=200361 RepID=A0A452ZKQ6_AEGTS
CWGFFGRTSCLSTACKKSPLRPIAKRPSDHSAYQSDNECLNLNNLE